MEQLYRVYLHTQNDESVREYIVTAGSFEQAGERALQHVKASNLGKPGRSQFESQTLTSVLAVTPTSQPHCLMIHSFPAAAIRQIMGS